MQVLGTQQFVYDVDDSIGADEVAVYDFSSIIDMHRVLKSTRKGKMSTVRNRYTITSFQMFANALNCHKSACLSRSVGEI